MLRVLVLADTHLGFDFPMRPRVKRLRRGPDFFDNTRRALQPARDGDVDLVVHGGDLLYRSKVPGHLVQLALEPLLEVADAGTPVVLVPGNHERSVLPYPILAAHENLHIFDQPRSIRLRLSGHNVVVAGFPCARDRVRTRFLDLEESTGARHLSADIRFLCCHQAIEGAQVGPTGYTFRTASDVVAGRSIPDGYAAVLCGHIHRAQTVLRDLRGQELRSPVIYPGAIERTSSAERFEPKGYVLLEVRPQPTTGGQISSWRFVELPTRPMVVERLDVTGVDAEMLERRVRTKLAELDPESVVQLRIEGTVMRGAEAVLRAARLRELHPPTMNVSLSPRPGRWS